MTIVSEGVKLALASLVALSLGLVLAGLGFF